VLDAFNLNFGGGPNGPSFRAQVRSSTGVTRVKSKVVGITAFAKYLAKHAGSIDHEEAAYEFVENASSEAILRMLLFFESLLNLLVERFDNGESSDAIEMQAAISAKRLQNAVEFYESGP
jgi:hypothetical protein